LIVPVLDGKAFEYLSPTAGQKEAMDRVRVSTALYASVLENILPPGADKTYVMRKLREIAMWSNVAITRNQDGAPRRDEGG
jgi:hypothetical protein